jgi:hypothetical protein
MYPLSHTAKRLLVLIPSLQFLSPSRSILLGGRRQTYSKRNLKAIDHLIQPWKSCIFFHKSSKINTAPTQSIQVFTLKNRRDARRKEADRQEIDTNTKDGHSGQQFA